MAAPSRSPFHLLRYFTTAGLIVVALGVVGAWTASVFVLRSTFMEMERDEADSLDEDLVALLNAGGFDRAQWGRADVPLAVRADVEREMRNFGIVEFALLDLRGEALAGFALRDTVPRTRWDEGFKAASAGDVELRWETHRPWPLLFFGGAGAGSIETYTPVREGRSVIAVARVRRDLAPVLDKARAALPGVLAAATLLLGAVFGGLWLIVRKGHRILATQRDEILAAEQELLRRNRILDQLNRRKDEFYAICSDELHEPLRRAVEGCRTLALSPALAGAERELLDDTAAHVRSAAALVSDLVDLARLETDGDVPRREAVDLVELVHEIAAASAIVAGTRGVELEIAASGARVALPGDRQRILRALSALVGDAIKLVAPGRLVISIAEPGGRPRVDVTGTLASGTTPDAAVRGLGLAGEVAAQHGGSVEVSEGEGRTATWSVVLPRDPVRVA